MWSHLPFYLTSTLFAGSSIVALWQLRIVTRLPGLEELPEAHKVKRCSVIIAARDEEKRIEATLRHLFAQQGVDLEIIVVDDRSADGTGAILHKLAEEDGRLRAERVEVLPDGWLGKCHACHIGATAASGDWFLFTDADCWLKPDVIARALRVAEREAADHIVMSAGTALEDTIPRAWYLLFLTSLLGMFSGVNRDRPKVFTGFGAFNLVRASAYRESGGYEALRLTVVDDMKLGLLLRRAGKRTRAFLGGDDVECHWGNTVRSLTKIFEKNYFAALDYRLLLVSTGSLFTLVVLGVVIAGLASGSVAGLVAGLSPLALVLPGRIMARRMGWSWPEALCMPWMFPAILYAVLNSTFRTLRQGGIRWRDTFYPLAELRAKGVK